MGAEAAQAEVPYLLSSLCGGVVGGAKGTFFYPLESKTRPGTEDSATGAQRTVARNSGSHQWCRLDCTWARLPPKEQFAGFAGKIEPAPTWTLVSTDGP